MHIIGNVRGFSHQTQRHPLMVKRDNPLTVPAQRSNFVADFHPLQESKLANINKNSSDFGF